MRTHHFLIGVAAAIAVLIALLLGWAIGNRGDEPRSRAVASSGAAGDLSGAVEASAPAVVMLSAGGSSAADALPMGSGFIISPDGYLVTTADVVRSLPVVTAILPSGAAFKAERVGTDSVTGIVLFRTINTAQQALPSLRLADSMLVKAGQPAMLIGAPYGLDGTVSAGIVAHAARRLSPDQPIDLIQTDIAFSAGGGGGPLLDAQGDVIGLATAQVRQDSDGPRVAFAIPSNAVKDIVGRLRAATPAPAATAR